MPTVLRANGFQVRIYTEDHTERPHVHVWKAGTVVVIELATTGSPQEVREAEGMRQSDVNGAFRLVAMNATYLLHQWRKIHGS